MFSSEQIGAVLVGAGGVITAWFTGRAKLKKVYENNGDSIVTRTEHELCRDQREKTEDRLFDGQEKLDGKMEVMRKENREDVQIICKKIDSLRN